MLFYAQISSLNHYGMARPVKSDSVIAVKALFDSNPAFRGMIIAVGTRTALDGEMFVPILDPCEYLTVRLANGKWRDKPACIHTIFNFS